MKNLVFLLINVALLAINVYGLYNAVQRNDAGRIVLALGGVAIAGFLVQLYYSRLPKK